MATIPYPGADATPQQLLALAGEYRAAAGLLRTLGRPRRPLSWAPFRAASIHAIELYLNALLVHRGIGPDRVRGLHHAMVERVALAVEHGISLRRRTRNHLDEIGAQREYLVSRYAPELVATSQINRLEATLGEVAEKVTALIVPPPA
jgi:hypothetical protein